ncbi:MAG: hypothetical protein OEW42_17230 [Acidimicrobiia bacterium]|nr:hypothetical protein [Acidimicrobiia bacterium]
MNVEALTRGLVAGYIADVITDRTAPPIRFGAIGAVVAMVGAAISDGWWRAPFVLFAITVAAVSWAVQRLALIGIARIGPPISGHRQAVGRALEEADLPTGPLSLLRLGRRVFTRGMGHEFDRLITIVADLDASLGEI